MMPAPRAREQASKLDDGFALDLLRSIRCGLIITDHAAAIRFINE